MFQLWMVMKYFRGSSRFITWSSLLSLLGMIIGVASLVATMAVVSGVETSLKNAIVDVSGDLILIKSGNFIEDIEPVEAKIKKALPDYVASSAFVHVEAVIAKAGKISGVVLEGEKAETVDKVVRLKQRLVAGSFSLAQKNNFDQNFDQLNFALQSGPYFDFSTPAQTHINQEYDRRHLVLKDDQNRFYFFSISFLDQAFSGPKLDDIPEFFSLPDIKKIANFTTALNLDGGSASAFYDGHYLVQELTPIGSLLCGTLD